MESLLNVLLLTFVLAGGLVMTIIFVAAMWYCIEFLKDL